MTASKAAKRGRVFLVTESLPSGVPASRFGRGDVFQLPGIPDLMYVLADIQPYHVEGWRELTFANEGELPMLMKADSLLLPVRMMRRWTDVPCMLCRAAEDVVLDMARHGVLQARICAHCS